MTEHEPLVINQGYCGGCETCGDRYEEVICKTCDVLWPCDEANSEDIP